MADNVFTRMLNEHAEKQARLKEATEATKKEALSAAAVVMDLLVDSVNSGVQEAFVNQKKIELEARALTATLSRFSKQNQQWASTFTAFDTALKEVGDFENWIKTIEFDLETLAGGLKSLTAPNEHPSFLSS